MTETLQNRERQEDIDEPNLLPLENIEECSIEENPKKRKVRDPRSWKVNIQKRKRLEGESYETKHGKTKPARPIKEPTCASNTKHECTRLVPEDERIKIYTKFRSFQSLQEQRHFIISHVTKKSKNRDTTQGNSRRKYTLLYTLTVNNEKKVVCREFVLATLNISGGYVKGALNKINSEGILEPDSRGKKVPPNKIKPDDETVIRQHILSFPAVESHYCRSGSDVKYLDASLNIATMYKEYVKLCRTKSLRAVCIEKYRSIFRSYKLSFHKPKKDLCKHCTAFKEMSQEERTLHQVTHTLHMSRKDEARKCRDEDKEMQNIMTQLFLLILICKQSSAPLKELLGHFYMSGDL